MKVIHLVGLHIGELLKSPEGPEIGFTLKSGIKNDSGSFQVPKKVVGENPLALQDIDLHVNSLGQFSPDLKELMDEGMDLYVPKEHNVFELRETGCELCEDEEFGNLVGIGDID